MTNKPSKTNGKPIHNSFAIRGARVSRLRQGLRPSRRRSRIQPPVLITGGAGFIGTNVADYYLTLGQPVVIYDNLSRPGVELNLDWIRTKHGSLVQVEQADILDGKRLRQAIQGASKVFHFAAQVAVTTSLESPTHDFEINARGTLNVLEALRNLRQPPPLVFTSTNKVYGALQDVRLRSTEARYEPEQRSLRAHGFDERRPLDFHSPYGCSKGAAEQYVLDYARTFRLPAVVFRMSCIYGPHQFGTEDQGWVAHFLIRALEGRPITVYGDGRQVRDILFVNDLVEAFVRANESMPLVSGQAFNIGGGSARTISLLELVESISGLQGAAPQVRFDQWRPADQQFYVSDIRKFSEATGWQPKVGVREGLERLCQWLRESVASPKARAVPGINCDARDPAHHTSSGSEARSKRIWRFDELSEPPMSGRIVKFP
ncbi:MAG: GDP-mannose 4,6-dehydratase [Verrucomicrobiia bacterium]